MSNPKKCKICGASLFHHRAKVCRSKTCQKINEIMTRHPKTWMAKAKKRYPLIVANIPKNAGTNGRYVDGNCAMERAKRIKKKLGSVTKAAEFVGVSRITMGKMLKGNNVFKETYLALLYAEQRLNI